jgi:hypothetical protein
MDTDRHTGTPSHTETQTQMYHDLLGTHYGIKIVSVHTNFSLQGFMGRWQRVVQQPQCTHSHRNHPPIASGMFRNTTACGDTQIITSGSPLGNLENTSEKNLLCGHVTG